MKVLGFRCWKDKYSYVIVEGSQAVPVLVKSCHQSTPVLSDEIEILNWFYNEFNEIIESNDFDKLTYKQEEPGAPRKDAKRVSVETCLRLAGIRSKKRVKPTGLVKASIKSKTGIKKAQYLNEIMNHNCFDNLPDKNFTEAVIVAVSILPI